MGEPAGAVHGAWVCWCRVSASGGARPPAPMAPVLCLSESGDRRESSGYTARVLSFPEAWE